MGRFVSEGPEVERFLSKVRHDPSSGCWLWIGGLNNSGYGQLWVADRPVLVHRYSWELFHGPIGEGLTLDHLCGRLTCVRPGHLEPVTNSENLRRRHARQRDIRDTTCDTGVTA